MAFYISQIILGIASGSLYGILGLSLMFAYRSTRVFNFALGQMATTVAFVALVLMRFVPPFVAVSLSFTFAFAFGIAVEAGIMKFVKEQNATASIIATIGIYAIVNSANAWFFGYDPYPFPSPFPEGGITIEGVFISYQTMGILSCTLAIALSLYAMFRFTLLGIAFQAISEDPMAARLKGIRVGILVSVAWGISLVLAGVGGMLVAHSLFLHPNTMSTGLLYAFSAAKIGGLQSSFGPLIGGLIVGVVENLAGTVDWIGSELKTVTVFIVLFIFLIFRPRGLFGRDEPRKI